ncbi:transcription initiation factor IIF subunit alpha-like [Papaver somniferum]|uniref:transcription initiation factor IIF subunit alpha-like n=1 Tax=Papaver somniferum TaxID=3469 RepID=UPI000E6FC8DB|nr:transcription initiation factor IIF subunit alpha-like [Papaver somniferum]
MSFDLKLKPSCGGCGSTSDLYGSNLDINSKDPCGFTYFQDDGDDDDEANEEEVRVSEFHLICMHSILSSDDIFLPELLNEADDDMSMSPVLAPKKKDTHTPKEELVDTPAKASHSASTPGTPSTKPKRKASGDDAKVANSAPLKTAKMETDSKSSAKEGSASASKGNNAIPLNRSASWSAKAPADPSTGPVTEEEIRAVLLESAPLTTQALVAEFRERLKSKEDKNAFAAILRRISKIQKFVVLRDNNAIPSRDSVSASTKAPAYPSTGPITEEEIRAVLLESAPLTTQALVAEFWERLKSKEEKNAFTAILRRILKIRKSDEANYVVLRDKINGGIRVRDQEHAAHSQGSRKSAVYGAPF